MKIVFHTNIDAYKGQFFPNDLDSIMGIPRKGDKIWVVTSARSYFANKNLPLRLEVVNVEWMHDNILCELWYNKTDKELADLAGAKTL